MVFSFVQERKFSPKRNFLGRISRGHPGVIRADIPAQNFGQGPANPGKTSILPRTSMTRRRGRPRPEGISKNFGQKNFGLTFRSLFVHLAQRSECTAVAAIPLRMRMRILTRPENSLANFCHQISNEKLRTERCEGIR